MDFQTIITIIILLMAIVYTILRFKKNWQKGDMDPKCENCEVPEIIKKRKESEN